MSLAMIQAVKAVRGISPTQRFVAWILADCHNEYTGRCDPSISHICELTGYSDRAIHAAIEGLEKYGFLSATRRLGGRNSYVLMFKTSEGGSPANDVRTEGGSLPPANDVRGTSERRSETSERRSPEPEEPERTRREPKAAVADGGGRKLIVDEDYLLACAYKIGEGAPPAVQEAWTEWQAYRQRRHLAKGKERKLWTLQSARLSAGAINQSVAKHGEQRVCDRIAQAIADNWQGLNLDKLDLTPNAKTHGTNNRSNHRPKDFATFRDPAAKAGTPDISKVGKLF